MRSANRSTRPSPTKPSQPEIAQPAVGDAAPFAIRGALLAAITKAAERLNVTLWDWPAVLGVSWPTFKLLVERGAPRTFKNLSTAARLSAVLDCPHVGLPDVPVDVTRADLARLRELKQSPFVDAFVDRRLAEVASGEVLDRVDAFELFARWRLVVPRVGATHAAK